MVNAHRSPKYAYHIGNRGRRIELRCQNLNRELGNSSFRACALRSRNLAKTPISASQQLLKHLALMELLSV